MLKYYILGISAEREYLVLRVENPISMNMCWMTYSDIVSEGGIVCRIYLGPYLTEGISTMGTRLPATKKVMLSNLALVESDLPLLRKRPYTVLYSPDKDSQSAEAYISIKVSSETYRYVESISSVSPFSLEEMDEDICDMAFIDEKTVEFTLDVSLSEFFDEFGECIYDI